MVACGSGEDPAPIVTAAPEDDGSGHETSAGMDDTMGDECGPCDPSEVCVEGDCRVPPECGP